MTWQKRATREDVLTARTEVSEFLKAHQLNEKDFGRHLECSQGTLYNLLHSDNGAYVPTLQMIRSVITNLKAHPEKLEHHEDGRFKPSPKPPLVDDVVELRERLTEARANGLRAHMLQRATGLSSSVISQFLAGRGLSRKSADVIRKFLKKHEREPVTNGALTAVTKRRRYGPSTALIRQADLPFMPPKVERAAVDAPPHPSHATMELVSAFINKVGMEAIQTLLLIAQAQSKKEGE